MKAKPSKRVAGIIIRSRKSIAKDGVVTVSVIKQCHKFIILPIIFILSSSLAVPCIKSFVIF